MCWRGGVQGRELRVGAEPAEPAVEFKRRVVGALGLAPGARARLLFAAGAGAAAGKQVWQRRHDGCAGVAAPAWLRRLAAHGGVPTWGGGGLVWWGMFRFFARRCCGLRGGAVGRAYGPLHAITSLSSSSAPLVPFAPSFPQTPSGGRPPLPGAVRGRVRRRPPARTPRRRGSRRKPARPRPPRAPDRRARRSCWARRSRRARRNRGARPQGPCSPEARAPRELGLGPLGRGSRPAAGGASAAGGAASIRRNSPAARAGGRRFSLSVPRPNSGGSPRSRASGPRGAPPFGRGGLATQAL